MQQWHRTTLRLGLALVLLAVLAGCGGEEPVAQGVTCDNIGSGDVAAGEILFVQTLEQTGGRGPRCSSCHAIDNAEQQNVGPGLQGIATIAATRVPDESAEEYLCKAIVAPQEYIVPGYPEDIRLMPITYGDALTQQQVDDLVAYLLTLE